MTRDRAGSQPLNIRNIPKRAKHWVVVGLWSSPVHTIRFFWWASREHKLTDALAMHTQMTIPTPMGNEYTELRSTVSAAAAWDMMYGNEGEGGALYTIRLSALSATMLSDMIHTQRSVPLNQSEVEVMINAARGLSNGPA